MRLQLNLDHLLVPAAVQRARHREFHRGLYPVVARAVPVPPPEPVVEPVPALEVTPAPTVEPAQDFQFQWQGYGDTPPAYYEERIAWMLLAYQAGTAFGWYRKSKAVLAIGALAFGTSRRALASNDRTHPVVIWRQVAMAFAYKVAGDSLPMVGRAFGNRDHTTVIHAVRKYGGMVERVIGEVVRR